MPSYYLFFRGLNAGKSKRLSMDTLKNLLEAAGLRGSRSALQSGNVFVASEKSPVDLRLSAEKALGDYFSSPVPCIVKSAEEINRILAENPFMDKPPNEIYLLLFEGENTLGRLWEKSGDTAHGVSGAIYAHYGKGILSTALGLPFFEKELSCPCTCRSLISLGKIYSFLQ